MLDGQRSELLRSRECDPHYTHIHCQHPTFSLGFPYRLHSGFAPRPTHPQPHHPQPPKHPDCMYSPLSPPAAVHLIHDPTIIRQSSAGPFPAQGDTHDDSEIYYFQRNICKWRQSEARVAPIFHRDMWLWKLMVNTLLFCLFHPHLVCSNTHLHVYFLLLDFKYSAAVATGKNWDFTPGFLQSN